MNNSNGLLCRRRRRTSASRRKHLLADFARSGLSAAAFAREHGVGYSTFCGWLHRQAKARPSPAFVEIEVSAPAAAVELWLEVGAHARLCLTSEAQLELAAQFLQHVEALAVC